MGTNSLTTYIQGEDQQAVIKTLQKMREDSLYEDGFRYDQGEWGGVCVDYDIFSDQEPVLYEDLDEDHEMELVKDKGDCRAVPVLVRKDDSVPPKKRTFVTYETTVSAEEVDEINDSRLFFVPHTKLNENPLIENLLLSILDAIEGQKVEIRHETVNPDTRQYDTHSEEIVWNGNDWKTLGVSPEVSDARKLKKTKGKRVTRYAVILKESNDFGFVYKTKVYAVYDTEKEAMDFIERNKNRLYYSEPEVVGIVQREDGRPLSKMESADVVIPVHIEISRHPAEDDLVKGYMIFAKSAS